MPDDNSAIDQATDTVAYHATIALESAAGNVAEAAKHLENAVRKSKKLWSALMEPLVTYACHQAVATQSRKMRDRSWNPPSTTRPGLTDAERVRILATGTLLMFPLPGGKKLAEATRGELAEAASFYEKQATDMSHKARWLQLVCQSLPDGKRVSQVLDESRLRELQEEAVRS